MSIIHMKIRRLQGRLRPSRSLKRASKDVKETRGASKLLVDPLGASKGL